MTGSSNDGGADVSNVCGADVTADGTDIGTVSYVDGEVNVSVVSDKNVVCCVDVTSVNSLSDVGEADVWVVVGESNVSVVSDTNVVCCVDVTSVTVLSDVGDADVSVVCGGDVTSVSGSSDNDDADVSVVCGADATADGTDVGSVSYVDGETNVPVVSDTNVVCCVDVTSVNGLSDVSDADVSVVCGADATADGSDVSSASYVDGGANVSVVSVTSVVCCVDVTSVSGSSDDDGADVWIVDGESNVSVVSDTNVVCCVDVTSAAVSSNVDDADVSVVCGGDATADGTDVGTVSSVDGEANASVVSYANVVSCVDVTSVNGLSDVGEADVSVF